MHGGILMDFQIKKRDWLFLLVCIGLGVLAEVSFFHGSIGVSFLVFLSGFCVVLLIRYRFSFTHNRVGILLMVCIGLLAGSYAFYDNSLFYNLNLLVVPVLLFSHIVLITSPQKLQWDTPEFLCLLKDKLGQGGVYCSAFFSKGMKEVFKNMGENTVQNVKRIAIGLLISVPLLALITGLLMSADAVFQAIILRFPKFIFQLDFQEQFLRLLLIVFFSLLFFSVFQVLRVKAKPVQLYDDRQKQTTSWDGITALTILVLLNSVYVLFTVIQFTYFFSDGLQGGFTYAEYARRGFFELLIATLINWTVLTSCLKMVKVKNKGMNLALKLLYSLLIGVSGVMLTSAYQRLSMYEEAYGFTFDRILAHASMIFLMVIFAYTFIRVWMERLSLVHFYLIAGLLFYIGLNVSHIEQIIVDQNLERYEWTEKIDINYLNSLSYTGVDGLIELYEMEPGYQGLRRILIKRQDWLEAQSDKSWQSFNITKQRVKQRLENLQLK